MSTKALEAKLLSVADLFGEADAHYEIPIYQRNYAWGVEQIEQLIDDVWQASRARDDGYFLGNLIVARLDRGREAKRVTYEVIDGQQRLTTLHMLLTFLRNRLEADRIELKTKLTYQSRRTATEALAGLTTSEDEEGSGIHTGFKSIESRMGRFDKNGDELERFAGFLCDRVQLVRAALPDETDLNKYFEIMNTRGQQLQQVDIVKARLMSYLRADRCELNAARACFAWIWDASSDMDSYIQMALTPGDRPLRSRIFGSTWDRLDLARFDELQSARPQADGSDGGVGSIVSVGLQEALNSYARAAEVPAKEDQENRRFESPIKFPSLLLHTLKVMRGSKDDDVNDDSGRLDDTKLIKLFGNEFQELPETERSNRTKQFAEELLRSKFVLDNFILKREFTGAHNDDGAWSLKRLTRGESVSGQGASRINARFPNAFAPGTDEWDDTPTDDATREILLLQSMLRVTYTSPRTMHWITAVLRLPILDLAPHEAAVSIQRTLRDYARTKVRQAFFLSSARPEGFNIERVVFTYLDYLLARGSDADFAADPNFTFVYRNSIEHFFPQYPDREQENWNRVRGEHPELHMFGNLALVSVGANSKFSNNLPENKIRFKETIKQSAKLRLMAKQAGGRLWDLEAINAHHEAMVELLRSDLRAGGLVV